MYSGRAPGFLFRFGGSVIIKSSSKINPSSETDIIVDQCVICFLVLCLLTIKFGVFVITSGGVKHRFYLFIQVTVV